MDERDYLRLDDQQAAGMFRLALQRGLGGCQFEGGRMRWWLPQGLLLELVEGEWRLSLVPTRQPAEFSESAAFGRTQE